MGPNFGGREVVAGNGFKRAMMASYRLSICMTLALSPTIRPQFAAECLRGSKQQVVGHFVAKFGKEGFDPCKPNFNTIWERHGAVVYYSYAKEIISTSSAFGAQ